MQNNEDNDPKPTGQAAPAEDSKAPEATEPPAPPADSDPVTTEPPAAEAVA